eukprot:767003-Hanusia_phi.AAC.3
MRRRRRQDEGAALDLRELQNAREGSEVSSEIVRCNQEFATWAEEYEERKQAAERSHAAALSPARSRLSMRSQIPLEQLSSQSLSVTSERSLSQALLR